MTKSAATKMYNVGVKIETYMALYIFIFRIGLEARKYSELYYK